MKILKSKSAMGFHNMHLFCCNVCQKRTFRFVDIPGKRLKKWPCTEHFLILSWKVVVLYTKSTMGIHIIAKNWVFSMKKVNFCILLKSGFLALKLKYGCLMRFFGFSTTTWTFLTLYELWGIRFWHKNWVLTVQKLDFLLDENLDFQPKNSNEKILSYVKKGAFFTFDLE